MNHPIEDVSRLICKICNAKFPRLACIWHHNKVKHAKKPTTAFSRCRFCCKEFVSKFSTVSARHHCEGKRKYEEQQAEKRLVDSLGAMVPEDEEFSEQNMKDEDIYGVDDAEQNRANSSNLGTESCGIPAEFERMGSIFVLPEEGPFDEKSVKEEETFGLDSLEEFPTSSSGLELPGILDAGGEDGIDSNSIDSVVTLDVKSMIVLDEEKPEVS